MRSGILFKVMTVAALTACAGAAQVPAELSARELASSVGTIGDIQSSIEFASHRMLKKKHHHKTSAPEEVGSEADEEEEETTEESEASPAPAKKKVEKKDTAVVDEEDSSDGATSTAETTAPTEAPKSVAPATEAPAATTQAPASPVPTNAPPASTEKAAEAPAPSKAATETTAPEASATSAVNDEKIEGKKNEGVIDHSSEGSAEIDKIDSNNKDGWVSVYDNPPLLVVKASLYAFIAYNDSKVCDLFNMTMTAVEQKVDTNDTHSYHVVTQINCTKNEQDTTNGKFILNFVPEGKRLLLTECGHREEGEILNWMDISGEVPQCMTPDQRKEYISQPMKHVHAGNGTSSDVAPTQTNFMAHLKLMDEEGMAIAGSATVILLAVVAVVAVFVVRKRKAQKDLERTIAGAKAERAVEDEEAAKNTSGTVERKGLMDSAKAKPSDVEEGSFVNSPSVKV